MERKVTFKCGPDKAVVKIGNAHGGSKTVFTITTDGYSLLVNGHYVRANGETDEDGIAIGPIDKNTIAVFI